MFWGTVQVWNRPLNQTDMFLGLGMSIWNEKFKCHLSTKELLIIFEFLRVGWIWRSVTNFPVISESILKSVRICRGPGPMGRFAGASHTRKFHWWSPSMSFLKREDSPPLVVVAINLAAKPMDFPKFSQWFVMVCWVWKTQWSLIQVECHCQFSPTLGSPFRKNPGRLSGYLAIWWDVHQQKRDDEMGIWTQKHV